jgi:hypothetical protein
MTKQNRKALRDRIVKTLDDLTEEQSNRGSVVTVGGHEIARRLIYAGGSQWTGCGRDWDSTESGWGWVVDGEYRLTTPDLFGFDGRFNMIERQTGFYLQDGYDEQTTPEHDGRDPLDQVPNRVLIEIGRGLADACSKAEAASAAEDTDAAAVLVSLTK